MKFIQSKINFNNTLFNQKQNLLKTLNNIQDNELKNNKIPCKNLSKIIYILTYEIT